MNSKSEAETRCPPTVLLYYIPPRVKREEASDWSEAIPVFSRGVAAGVGPMPRCSRDGLNAEGGKIASLPFRQAQGKARNDPACSGIDGPYSAVEGETVPPCDRERRATTGVAPTPPGAGCSARKRLGAPVSRRR